MKIPEKEAWYFYIVVWLSYCVFIIREDNHRFFIFPVFLFFQLIFHNILFMKKERDKNE